MARVIRLDTAMIVFVIKLIHSELAANEEIAPV